MSKVRPPRMVLFATYIAFALILLSLLAWTTPAGAATFKNLSQRLPAHANTIIMVNVEKIWESPVAQKEGWRQEHEKSHAAGLTLVPPACDRFLMASNLDLEFFQPQWEAAIAEVHYEPNVPEIAVRHGGTVDNINGRDAALLPHDTYVVKFGPKLMGAMSPANRQSATRWLKRIYATGEKPQSDYITQAMSYADKVGTPVIMAIDFENALSQQVVRERLNSIESLPADRDLDKTAEVLASMRGVTLGIAIRDRAFGKLKVEFAKDLQGDPEVAKALLLEVLGSRGIMVDEFNEWKAEIKGKQFSIEGPLFASGMRRIFSVLETPAAFQESVAKMQSRSEEDQAVDLVVVSSQQYFKSTQHLLDDLKEKKPNGGFKTAGQIGGWYEKYAKRIDHLPMSNVDPELLDYGGYVSSALRQAHGSMTSIGANKRVRQAEANVAAPIGQVTNVWGPGGGGRWGRFGGYGSSYGAGFSGYRYSDSEQRQVQQRERTAIATQERVRGFNEAGNIMTEVADATSDIRRRMTEKYNVNF